MSQITAFVLGGGGGGGVLTLTGNSGGAVSPTAGNINILGAGILAVAGNPGTSTLTISITNPIPIANGGTNATSMATTDGVVYFDGTRLVTTAVGTATQVLTSNGAGLAPTFQPAGGGGGVTSITGNSGGALTGALTLTGGSSGGTFAGSGTTLTMSFAELNLPDTSSSSSGLININGVPFLHKFGAATNAFGGGAGNFTLSGPIATTGFGEGSLAGLTTGGTNSSYNTAMGYNCLTAVNSGFYNSFVGAQSGLFMTTAQNNSGIGTNAGILLVSGTDNCFFGTNAGNALTSSESSNILIGSGVSGTVSTSNLLRIGAGTGTGTGQQNQCFISGIQGISVTGTAVLVSASDQLGIAISSERYKEDIEDMDDYSDEIMDLRPVTFNYKQEPNAEYKSVGLIAEEVQEVMPNLVIKDKEGLPMTVRYLDLIPMLLNEVQKLKKTIDKLEQRLEELE